MEFVKNFLVFLRYIEIKIKISSSNSVRHLQAQI